MFSVVLCCCPCSLSPFSPLLPPAVPLGIPLDSICGRRASISEGMGDEEEDVELRRLHNEKESLEEEIEGLQVAVAEWIERLDQMSTGLVSEESLVLEVSTLRQAASDWFEETLQDSTRISELEAQKGALEVEKGQLEAELQALKSGEAQSEPHSLLRTHSLLRRTHRPRGKDTKKAAQDGTGASTKGARLVRVSSEGSLGDTSPQVAVPKRASR